MNIKTLKLGRQDFPEALQQMETPPKQLYVAGDNFGLILSRPRVAIVGSRNMSAYGKRVTRKIASDLAEQGIVIISGLALGVDACAHRATLDVGGLALVVLPSPLDNIVPATNRRLAQEILDSGGVIVSEYGPGVPPQKQNFIARNRLVTGLADALLITEAGAKSGTIHTANFALKQGIDVLAVPGDIHSPGSAGTNNIIRAGAGLVTSYHDVINVLGLEDHKTTAREVRGRNQNEQTVLDLLMQGTVEGEELHSASELSTADFNRVLTMLELGGKIKPLGGNKWSIY